MLIKVKKLTRSLLRLAAAGALLIGTVLPAMASSHREAPFITELPKVDSTDLYMFKSYEPGREGFVTLIADYQPFQDPFAGPNYYFMDPEALYEIHIDNDGDAKEDLTFQFRFKNTLANLKLPVGDKQIPIPLIQAGPISPADTSKLNLKESYTVKLVRGNRRTGTAENITNATGGATEFAKPVDNIGAKTIPDYAAYAAAHIHSINIPGCNPAGRMFVGQRKEPFAVKVGELFDLVNLDPVGPPDAKTNDLANKNITSLILEVPIACLTADANTPVIGAWQTASLRQARLLDPTPSFSAPAKEGGAWTQVSRLGMPLVNEIVIGIPDKDRFNASKPQNDAQFIDYVTHPTLPALLSSLFGVQAPAPPRNDLVTVFLSGVPNVNQTATPAEMLRLNTALPATPRGSQNNLGAALCFIQGTLTLTNPGCDPAGFPNGRRPGDDVVDIELRVAMGFLLPTAAAPNGQDPFTDGVTVRDTDFGATFPYLNTPLPGAPSNLAGG
jgi:hypothetical protein